jgi:hypothetical protein
MYRLAKENFCSFIGTFRGSETIIWARLQVALGAAWLVLSRADLTPLDLKPEYAMYWMLFNGFISEMLRRNREDWDGK